MVNTKDSRVIIFRTDMEFLICAPCLLGLSQLRIQIGGAQDPLIGVHLTADALSLVLGCTFARAWSSAATKLGMITAKLLVSIVSVTTEVQPSWSG